MRKINEGLKSDIKASGFYHYEIGSQLGMHETTFCRLLRKELSEENKQRIYRAIDELKNQREAQESHSAISG